MPLLKSIKGINKTKMLYQSSYERLVISGNVVELYNYELPLIKGCSHSRSGRATQNKTDELTKLKNRQKTKVRAKTSIARLVNANARELQKFVTLTFAENITDIKYANKKFKEFIQRLNYRNKRITKYIVVMEFQTRGAIHYHMLCDLPYIDSNELAKIWSNGFIKINKIDNIDNVGTYITKYMNKDLFDSRLQGKKCYFTSRNLKKPIETINKVIIDEIVPKLEPIRTYVAEYSSEYNGNVVYTQYVLKNSIAELYDNVLEQKGCAICEMLRCASKFSQAFSKRLNSPKTLTKQLRTV